jgi:type I restriction enzyme M protein
MKIAEAFKEFDKKYSKLSEINTEWYHKNCGVFSTNKIANAKNSKGVFSEEYYRARMVWSLVETKMYLPENICVEFCIPKGSEGAKSLNPDIIVFKTDAWKTYYKKWDKSKSLPEELAKEMLIVWEAKENSSKVESAVTKQMAEAMNSYVGEQVYGVYFDNQIDVLIFRKEGTNPVKRYNPEKTIDGEGISKLNLGNRDSLTDLPSFKQFYENLKATEDVSKLNFSTNQPIDEDSFTDLLEFINRQQDKLNLSRHVQDLIVEFLTLKVADEKEVKKKKKKFFEFYIKPEEIKNDYGTQEFRKRLVELYAKTKDEYKSIFNPPAFKYDKKGDNLTPSHGDDEKFLIGLIKVFQKKTILETQNANFNQIIFNNFGSSVEKAKDKQFFTPVPIVESIIKIVNPQKDESICDPCSGICDFLAMGFRHIFKDELEKLPSADKFFAFDKDNKILKLAELNLVLNGDGNANIKIMDSVSCKLLIDGTLSTPRNSIEFNIDNYNPEDWSNNNDENKNPLRYDTIVTNPPFGKGRDLQTGRDGKWDVPKKTMELYETWNIKEQPKSIDLGIVFLENSYKLLKEGGRMAIVLSNSIASIAEWQSVREWFISKMRIVALFDLPANTFGETGVATTVFVAYKPKANELHILEEDYEVYIKEIENVGYTVKTKDRIIIMSPDFVINETTFEREKDSKGNDKRLSDLPDLVNGFGSWLQNNKHQYKEIYKAFSGSNFQKWEI